MRFLKKLCSIICKLLLIIFVLFLFINIMFIYTYMTNMNEIPNVFGYKPVIIKDNSMKNKLNKNDLLIVKKLDKETIVKTADIVTFRDSNRNLVTHRIISIEKQGTTTDEDSIYQTKADNKKIVDKDKLLSSNIEGIYVVNIKKMGKYLYYFEKPLYVGITIPITILLIIIVILIGGKCDTKKKIETTVVVPIDNNEKEG